MFCTFGDAMRVPGKTAPCCRRNPAAPMRIVYSPMDALKLAQQNPREVVFFGLGFETTMPATALTPRQARERNVDNFFCQQHHPAPDPAQSARPA